MTPRHSRGSDNVDPGYERADRQIGGGKTPRDPRYPRSSGELVAALASTAVQNLASGAGGHPRAKAVLLGTFANIWLVSALHLFSESSERGADVHQRHLVPRLSGEGHTRAHR